MYYTHIKSYGYSCSIMYPPMQSVSDTAWHDRISTSSSLHSEHGIQVWLCSRSSVKVPGPHGWHMVFPSGPHSRTTPSPRPHLAHGAQTALLLLVCLYRQKPLPQSQWVSLVIVQRANWGTPTGHCEQGRHPESPSEPENVTPVMREKGCFSYHGHVH